MEMIWNVWHSDQGYKKGIQVCAGNREQATDIGAEYFNEADISKIKANFAKIIETDIDINE